MANDWKPGDADPSQFNVLKNPYVDSFTSISGSDIVGVFGHVEFLNLQGVSISVNREVHPIYVMGRTDPVSFVRGKRGVAGSLVAIATDRGALWDIMTRWGVYSRAVGDEPMPSRSKSATEGRLTRNVLSEDGREQIGSELAVPDYIDQLPPFDITLVGRSETLSAAISRIGGVFIVSMGTGISVDDNSIEQQMTFVALFYEDWRPVGRRNWQDGYEDRRDRTKTVDIYEEGEQGENSKWFEIDTPEDTVGEDFGLRQNTPDDDSNDADGTVVDDEPALS